MNKKIFRIITVLATFSFLLAACQRPASVSPTIAPTATSNGVPFPVATQPQIMSDILKQTQTALAQQSATESFPMVTHTPDLLFNTPATGGLPTMNTTPAVGGESTPNAGVTPSAGVTPVVLATATPTKIAYPTPTPGRPATYTVQPGEYLWCLARRFDVSIDALYSANGMNYQSQPAAGTVLNIPQSGSFGATRARQAHPATYTVRAGDTMGSIACWYGDADPNTIYAANGLQPGSVITVGQVLQIP